MRSVGKNWRAGLVATMLAIVAGCSGNLGSKRQDNTPPPDPNVFPANYRTEILTLLRQSLQNRGDFRGALISQPVLKPVGDNQHFVACVQLNSNGQVTTKAAIFLGGRMTQFIDAAPEQCGDAVYEPFKELENAAPGREQLFPIYRP